MGTESVGPVILAEETGATASADASTCVTIARMDATTIMYAGVAIVGDLCLEVRDGGHEGLNLCHRGLVLVGEQRDIGEVLLGFLVGKFV